MSECGANCDCKNQKPQEEKKTMTLEEKVEQLLNHPKALAPMGIGGKMYLKQMFDSFMKESLSRLQVALDNVSNNQKTFEQTHVNKVLAEIKKIDDKYRALYGTLVNRYLVMQDQKLFASEVAVQTLRELLIEELKVDKEAFEKRFETKFEEIVKHVTEKAKQAMVEAEKEKSNEVAQETPVEQEPKAQEEV